MKNLILLAVAMLMVGFLFYCLGRYDERLSQQMRKPAPVMTIQNASGKDVRIDAINKVLEREAKNDR